MRKISGRLLCAIFGALGLLHIYWALGGHYGQDRVLPTQDGIRLLTPTTPMTWAVALALSGALATTLGRMGLWGRQLPPGLFCWGMRSLSLIFALRAIGD